jgi:hypothetical protein
MTRKTGVEEIVMNLEILTNKYNTQISLGLLCVNGRRFPTLIEHPLASLPAES